MTTNVLNVFFLILRAKNKFKAILNKKMVKLRLKKKQLTI